jgi:serine O-acetyltransferase
MSVSEEITSSLIDEYLNFLNLCLSRTIFQVDHSSLFSVKNEILINSLKGSLEIFHQDLIRYNQTLSSSIRSMFLNPPLLAVFFYRLSHQLYLNKVSLLPDILAVTSRQLTGTEIYYSADIGPGFLLVHGLGTVIGSRSRIGSNFTCYHQVTIGSKGGEGGDDKPKIGDNVIIYVGAKVLGDFQVGEKTIIGANSILLKSTSGLCIVAGQPAEVKKNLTEQEFLKYYKYKI